MSALSAVHFSSNNTLSVLDWNSSPADAPKVKEVKRALFRLRAESTSEFKRDPLPAEAVVRFILGVVEEGLQEEPYFQQCCLLLLIGFRLMLRAKSLSLLKFGDVSVKDWGLEVALAPIKAMQSWQRKHIERSNDWRLCPVFWFNEYKRNSLPERELLFTTKGGGPISSIVVTELVRKVAKYANIEGDFSSHSIRIGGATAAALGGLSVHKFKQLVVGNRWLYFATFVPLLLSQKMPQRRWDWLFHLLLIPLTVAFERTCTLRCFVVSSLMI